MRGHIHVRQLKRGKQYAIVYDISPEIQPDGSYKRKQKWQNAVPNTRKAAEKLLAKRLQELHTNDFIEPSGLLFSDFVDKWVEKYARGQVKPGTLVDYESYFRLHLLPIFGNISLRTIKAEDIHGFKSAKLAEGLSAQTVKHLLRLIRQILQHAVDWNYLRENPANKVKFPSVPRYEMDCLDPEEVDAFLNALPERYQTFFEIAITTGLRMGELLAMKWCNIDWKRELYFVRESLARSKGGYKGGLATPKTTHSAQSVEITTNCIRLLKKHEKKQAEEKLRVGETYLDQGLIFATTTGTPLNSSNIVNRQFHKGLEAAGLRRIRFHDLRHTCASLLINQGVNPKYIQRQLRHSSINTTFDRYGHLYPETSRKAKEILDKMIHPGTPDKTSFGSSTG